MLSTLFDFPVWTGTTLVVIYLILRFNSVWIYKGLDRAIRNDRKVLPESYELPRYYKNGRNHAVDFSARWPGWDGWYFFVLPKDPAIPAKMARGSLMTGLYGLEGIDNYDRVSLRLGNAQEVEFLCLIPTEEVFDRQRKSFSHLSHYYLPKASDLEMETDKLDVSICGLRVQDDEETLRLGRIRGRWPNYQLQFINQENEIRIDLNYEGKDIIWWADIPGLFTYFAAFGTFQGEIQFQRGNNHPEPHRIPDAEQSFSFSGFGCFEHGFARKPFDFDPLWSPLRFLKSLAPSLKFVRYHYELFIGSGECYGGFMFARGFGINFRNRGGFFQDGSYTEIRKVDIEYPQGSETDQVDDCIGNTTTSFPRRWKVRAETEGGELEYTAFRTFPPALVASNMTYYHFTYEGHHQGQAISGKGYGEYAHI
ncbi:MAG TPA: hypothetical protein VMW38_23930 [Terriglobia bacterium]|nr:hypothetical protein [Terriglobia bacterium]